MPMPKLRVLDLFSGIGGFSLGLERTGGFETVAFCEIEPFPRSVLAKHWPEVPCYEDVRELTASRLAADGITGIDVITGGFPCQDISTAGRQAGIGEGTRSGLWSEIVRLIGELRPRYVIVENVANLLRGPSERPGGWFGRVLGDLAECGYDAEWENIPASAMGAPHRRERIWLCSYTSRSRLQKGHITTSSGEGEETGLRSKFARMGGCYIGENVANSAGIGQQGQGKPFERSSQTPHGKGQANILIPISERTIWSAEPNVGRVANGVPDRVDRLKGLGNAVVPQIPELIGASILKAEMERARA